MPMVGVWWQHVWSFGMSMRFTWWKKVTHLRQASSSWSHPCLRFLSPCQDGCLKPPKPVFHGHWNTIFMTNYFTKWVELEPLVSNDCEMLTELLFNCILMQTILSKGDSNKLWYQVMQPTPNVSTHQCVPFWKRMGPMIKVEWTPPSYFLCLLDECALKHQLLPFWFTLQQKVNISIYTDSLKGTVYNLVSFDDYVALLDKMQMRMIKFVHCNIERPHFV